MNVRRTLQFSGFVWNNLANRPSRTIATVFSLALIAATLFSSQYLTSGAQASLDAGISRIGADILVVPEDYAAAGENVILTGSPSSFFFENSGFSRIAKVPGVAKASPQLFIATLFASCCAAPVQMIAIDPETDFTIAPWLERNRGMTLGKDEIIIGSAVIQDAGKELMFYGHIFHVAGRLEETGTGVDNAVFLRTEDAYVMAAESREKAVKELVIPAGMVSAVLVKVEPGADPGSVAGRIRAEVPGTRTILPDGLMRTVTGQLGAVTSLLRDSTVAVAIVSIPLLAVLSLMVANERKREFAILRALGAKRHFLARLILAESVLLALAGGLAGMGAAGVALVFFEGFISLTLGIPLIVPGPGTILYTGGITVLLTVAISCLASLYPVIRVSQSGTYGTIRGAES